MRSERVELRRIVQYTYRKYKNEIGLHAVPVHFTGIGHACGDRYALHIEDDLIADLQLHSFGKTIFYRNRYLTVSGSITYPFVVDEPFGRCQAVAVSDAEFVAEYPHTVLHRTVLFGLCFGFSFELIDTHTDDRHLLKHRQVFLFG